MRVDESDGLVSDYSSEKDRTSITRTRFSERCADGTIRRIKNSQLLYKPSALQTRIRRLAQPEKGLSNDRTALMGGEFS